MLILPLLRSLLSWRALLLLAAAALIGFVPLPQPAPPGERHFRVEAASFAYSPAVLQVQPGDRVTIELVAQDVVHGLAIDGYDVNLTADPGQTVRASFVADRRGSFRIRCTAPCGDMHPFMSGKFVVGGSPVFWRAGGLALVAAAALLAKKRP